MGRDHEFLEAARNGNIAVVEKFLLQKTKKSGPLASLRRGPGVNVQDSSGYSALHHAALNGHTDIVRLLLAHDASTNLSDSRGSSPLHLAAWAGHQEIVKVFLTHPYNPANANLQTIEKETPLHCAAQYGHTGALTTLLAHGADPNMTNCRNETPLDLAAQYGRLQAVQMLIRAHPELLLPFKHHQSLLLENNENSSFGINKNTNMGRNNCGDGGNNSINSRCNSRSSHTSSQFSIETTSGNLSKNSNVQLSSSNHITNLSFVHNHTPLHLASRNGHKNVVEILLAAGVDVNVLTTSGTALHEAALCGKDNVVRTLLDSGADLDATDCEGRTALDILEEFPPHVTRGIVSVINNYRKFLIYDSESDDVQKYNQRPNNYNNNSNFMTTPMSLGSSYETNRISPIQNYSSSHYDITTSPSSSMGSLGPPSPSPRFRTSNDDIPDEIYQNKKTTVTPTTMHLSGHYKIVPNTTQTTTPTTQSSRKPTAPKKPPRRNLSISPTRLLPTSNNISNYITISINGNSCGSNNKISSSKLSSSDYATSFKNIKKLSSSSSTSKQYQTINNGKDKFRSYSADQCINSMSSLKNRICNRNTFELNLNQIKSSSFNLNKFFSNTTLKSYNPNRKLKRNRDSFERFNIDFNKDKAYYESLKNFPQSPTNYQQPPTPEHPPPTPLQAEIFINERIRPLNQEYKRRSALQNVLTIESGTSTSQDGVCSSFRASSGSISSSVSISDRSMSTDCVEEYVVEDIPFAGLFKGSIMNLDNSYLYYSTFPNNQNNQYYNNDDDDEQIENDDHIMTKEYFIERCKIPPPLIPRHGQRSHSFSGILDQNNDSENDQNFYDDDDSYYNPNVYNNIKNNDEYFENNSGGGGVSVGNGVLSTNHFNNDDCNINNENYENHCKDDEKYLKTLSGNDKKILNSINDKDDETWSKIAEIMETFGKEENITDHPITVKNPTTNLSNSNINDDNKSDKSKTNTSLMMMIKTTTTGCEKNQLHNILAKWNLLHLEVKFIENGYDNKEFINAVIDENDLMLMDIPTNEHKKILEMVKTLPKTEPLPCLHGNSNSKIMLTVDQWLKNIDLSEYIEDFRKHLYTNMDMVCQVWEVELQTVLEIKKIGHRKRILLSVSSNRKPPPPKTSTTTINELNCDLNKIKAQNISDSNINKPDSDNNKTKIEQQQPKLGITTTTLAATATTATISTSTKSTTAKSITPTTASKPNDVLNTNNTSTILTTINNTTTTTTNTKINANSKINTNNTTTTGHLPVVRHGNRKNRPAPKPPIKPAPPLEIRAPSELLLGLPSNLRTQWRHNASALVCSSIKYDVYYLGSTIVKELRGTESTRKSIQKLKRDDRTPISSSTIGVNACSIQQPDKINENEEELLLESANTNNQQNENIQPSDNRRRPIRLQISYRGVEFIDIENEKLICVHEIRNINCACQDADDLSHFAYITKDCDNQIYYCHVFNVNSMDLATEIILTLGQAFEVAYQLALQGTINSINLQPSKQQPQQQQQQHQIKTKEKLQQVETATELEKQQVQKKQFQP